MRVLLVTWIDKLAEKLAVFNPELDYCAIVVDDVEFAKKISEQIGLPEELFHSMDDLKKCIETFDYDYVLCVQDKFYDFKVNMLQKYDLPKEKVLSFAALSTVSNFQTKRRLTYFSEYSQEFEIFATGTSTAETSIDIREFKRKAVNFATSSQDLYYNLQIAKAAVLCGGGGILGMHLSDLRHIHFISISPRPADCYCKAVCCRFLSRSETCTISPCPPKFTKTFSARNG